MTGATRASLSEHVSDEPRPSFHHRLDDVLVLVRGGRARDAEQFLVELLSDRIGQGKSAGRCELGATSVGQTRVARADSGLKETTGRAEGRWQVMCEGIWNVPRNRHKEVASERQGRRIAPRYVRALVSKVC